MSTRPRVTLRGLLPAAFALLAGWKLSVVVMIAGVLYEVLLAIWARSSPPHVVQSIATLAPFWVFYALVLANTAVCLWCRVPLLVREVGAGPVLDSRRPAFQQETGPRTASDIRDALRRRGYRVVARGEGLWGVRRRWSPIGTYVFHLSFFLLAIGFLTTRLFRDESRVWVAVGETFSGTTEQFVGREPPRRFSAGPPETVFTVDGIRPELWRDELLFTELSADLRFADGTRATTRINRPILLGPASFLRLSGFGYAPRYEVIAGGRAVESAFVKMNVFPPGQRDTIRPRAVPHRVYVEIYPDLAMDGDEPVSRTLNLREPGFRTEIYRGKVPLAEAVLRLGEPIAFDGLVLRFPEIRYWGEFTLLRDPGAPILLVAFALGLTGLALKLRGRRAEVAWSPHAAGGVLRGFGAAEEVIP